MDSNRTIRIGATTATFLWVFLRHLPDIGFYLANGSAIPDFQGAHLFLLVLMGWASLWGAIAWAWMGIIDRAIEKWIAKRKGRRELREAKAL